MLVLISHRGREGPHWASAQLSPSAGWTVATTVYLIAWGELFTFCHEHLQLRHSMLLSDKHAYLFATLGRWQLDC